MTAWIALVVASLLTLALRAGPSLINNGIAVPAAIQRANRFAAPALMGALATRSVASQAAATGGIPALAAVVLAVPITSAPFDRLHGRRWHCRLSHGRGDPPLTLYTRRRVVGDDNDTARPIRAVPVRPVGRHDPSNEAAIDKPSQHTDSVVDRITTNRPLDHVEWNGGGAEQLVEAWEQHGRREGPHVRRRQLDCQREAVDRRADAFDARAICPQVERWVDTPSTRNGSRLVAMKANWLVEHASVPS